jgi:hypothetical protein
VNQVAKEFRALAAPWLGALVLLLVLPAVRGGGAFRDAGTTVFFAVYFFAVAALGALSVGHEYNHGTLAILLAQPISRGRLLRAKAIVLVPMILTLVAVAAVTAPARRVDGNAFFWGAPLFAICVAPWLTMICRSTIAGAVFANPGTVFITCNLILLAIGKGEAGWRPMLWAIAAISAAAAGAVMSVRTFLALEVIEGRDAPLQLPQWLRRSPDTAAGTARHPLWMLVKKELHLQHMSFVVAAIYVFIFATIWASRAMGAADVDDVFTLVSLLYSLMLAVLIGALSSAEERHLGTIQWQVMLPLASWMQWTIKVAVALVLAVLLSVVLPAWLGANFQILALRFVVPVLLVTSCAIYVSSRSASGIQALLISFVVIAVAGIVIGQLDPYLSGVGVMSLSLFAAALAVVALRLGLIHYRTL